MFEVQSSELALQKATDAKIKEFAQRMVADHKASNDRLKSTLQSAPLPPPPAALDKKHKEMMDELQAAGPGREFDRAYLDTQVKAHKEAMELFWTYAREGDNPELKTFAQQAVPTLEDHFKHVQNIEGADTKISALTAGSTANATAPRPQAQAAQDRQAVPTTTQASGGGQNAHHSAS
jgi:putative membrane protein